MSNYLQIHGMCWEEGFVWGSTSFYKKTIEGCHKKVYF